MSPFQFTALIRLPFTRGGFEDPPQVTSGILHAVISLIHGQVQWDADKDRQLWKVISKSSRTSDLNCE
jgi:hypothetical protein